MTRRSDEIKLKKFEAAEKDQKAADIECIIAEFEVMTVELDREIIAEETRTGVCEPSNPGYSLLARSARLRRQNLQASLAEFRVRLAAARRERDDAFVRLANLGRRGGGAPRQNRSGMGYSPIFALSTK